MSEHGYLALLQKILDTGEDRSDRTGVGTLSLFGEQMAFDLGRGFPLLTTNKISSKAIIHELLWFISGETNVKYLREHGVGTWDEWTDGSGELGPIYGEQWRSWGLDSSADSVDQLRDVVWSITNNPHSRRHIVTAWNPSYLPDESLAPCSNPPLGKMALAPCSCLFQFYVRDGTYLDCQLYQRSGDIFSGIPFNIASYALLTSMIAGVCDLTPGKFIHTLGDIHLYKNRVSSAQEQLNREPRELPQLKLNRGIEEIDNFKYNDIQILNYNPHPPIKARIGI